MTRQEAVECAQRAAELTAHTYEVYQRRIHARYTGECSDEYIVVRQGNRAATVPTMNMQFRLCAVLQPPSVVERAAAR